MANIQATIANLQKSLGPLTGQWQVWAGLLAIVLLAILKFRLTYLLTHHRWIFVIFLLPVSVCYEVFWFVRGKYVFWRQSAPKQHDKRVAYVQQQIKEWNAAGRQTRMCTARPSWLTMSITHGKYKKTHRAIEINLADVLEVDTRKKTVRVEPLCTMGQISATLLPLGWTLPVVPELDDLTVGGVINGVGVETSSHKYGLFCETCVAYELVLADGSFVRCSPDENPELFYAVPWSHGTLGFLVAAEINIVPAKKYVRLQYFPTHTRDAGVDLFTKACRDKSNDFVEALMYNENQMVTMIGHYTDQPESGKVNSIGHYYKPWFYKHVETFLKAKPTSNGNPVSVEYLPLRHYYHRHTRSIFWELSDIVPFGNHPLWRYTLGWTMPPKISLLKLTTTGAIRELYEKHHVTQDFLVPISTLADSLKVMHEDFLVYPLWICPFKISEPGKYRPFCRPLPGDELYVDVGAYGVPKNPAFVAKPTVRKVEEFVRRVKGYQMLYADSYMTRQEFREMFDHSMYDVLRKKLKCEDAFPEVYDKVSKEART